MIYRGKIRFFDFGAVSKVFLISFGLIIPFKTSERDNMTFNRTKKGFEVGFKFLTSYCPNSLLIAILNL